LELRSLGFSLISHVRSCLKNARDMLTTRTVYGLGLSSPQIVNHIWDPPSTDPLKKNHMYTVYETLRNNSQRTLVMVSIGTITGGLLMIKIVKYVSPKVIQFWGFIALFVLFMVTGSAWTKLLDSGAQVGIIVLYVLSHIAFNLGPNVTTFIVSLSLPSFYSLPLTIHRSQPKSSPLGTDAHATASLRPPANSVPGSCRYRSQHSSIPRISTRRRNTSDMCYKL
jgi:hypothetical protein